MNITELLSKVGAKDIEFQTLSECLKGVYTGKKQGMITFYTTKERVQELVDDPEDAPMGLILWVSRAKLKEILKP